MAHRLVGARHVRGRDRRDPIVERQERIDDDEAVAVVEQALELVARLLRQDDQRAVGLAVHEPVEQRDLAVVLVAGRREDDAHVLLVQRLGRAREDRREVRRVDERHEDADQPGAAGREAARAAVRRVAVLADRPAGRASRVSSETSSRPLSTRETVAIETPARSAIWRIVMREGPVVADEPGRTSEH